MATPAKKEKRMIKAVEMTSKSWVLYGKIDKLGLLRKIDDEGYGVIGGPFPGDYKSLTELEKKAGDEIKFQKPDKIKVVDIVEQYLENFPVKHIEIFDVNNDSGYPTYTKKENSNDRYAAGYWGFEFKGTWQKSFCPRVKTINENPWIGPFKTKLEVEHEIRIKNNKKDE